MVAALTVIHVLAGALGLAAGLLAFVFRKGGPLHRLAGRLFVGAMLVMAGLGAGIAAFEPDRVSVEAGLLTFYLVLTGWLTVRRRPGSFGLPEIAALALAATTAVMGLVWGFEGLGSPTGQVDGIAAQVALVFAGLAGLGALLDASVVLRRGVRGGQRLARHLWRMGIALVIAAAAFFLGQQQVFPEAMRGLGLAAPVLALLAWTFAWIGLALAGWPRRRAVA